MASYWKVNGKELNEAEYEEYLKREEEAKERVRLEVSARVRRLGEDYAALTKLLEQHPEVSRKVTDTGDRQPREQWSACNYWNGKPWTHGVKSTPNWDGLGCDGMKRGGVGGIV
jgi:hypothetical protein